MFERILLPLDGSTLAECVLPHAVALARATNAQLVLVYVLEPAPEQGPMATDPLQWHLLKAETKAYLDEICERLRRLELAVEGVQLEGPAAERIVEYARENGIDLLLLSSHGRSGLTGWNVSSVVQKVILRVNRSVMIVRAYDAPEIDLESLTYKRILIPLDGSRRAEYVLPIVASLARYGNGELMLATAITRPEMPRRSPLSAADAELAEKVVERNREEAEKYHEQLCSWFTSDRVTSHLLVGNSAITLLHRLSVEEGVDLIALSAHGYSGDVHRPYGSLVTSFIVYGSTPLLIIQDLPADMIESTQAEVLSTQTLVSDRVQGGPTGAYARASE
jgi:nucleotide-binding universal stress UspA family protein